VQNKVDIKVVGIKVVGIKVVGIKVVGIKVVDITVGTTVDITGITDITTDIMGTGMVGGGILGLE
jgi:hypothetical protein